MYEEHPEFHSPPSEAVLWRYMDFTKFVSLLDRQALFFARSDKLGDPFEGSFPRGNLKVDPASYADPYPPDLVKGTRHFVRDIRPFTLINSWHESPHESAAMWRLYSGEREGIAVKTNFSDLSASLISQESIFIGRVSYIDFDTDIVPELNAFTPFLQKRKSFEHENEVRAINLDLPWPPDFDAPDGPDGPKAIDLSIATYEIGTYREVDLSRLINEMVVGPYASDWFTELVQSVTSRYGLGTPVRKSALADEPTWG